jgi:hypothetical protein
MIAAMDGRPGGAVWLYIHVTVSDKFTGAAYLVALDETKPG